MLVWGWRIPFLLAFLTAILGFVLRLGMPEPKAFLAAARAAKAAVGADVVETGSGGKPGSKRCMGENGRRANGGAGCCAGQRTCMNPRSSST